MFIVILVRTSITISANNYKTIIDKNISFLDFAEAFYSANKKIKSFWPTFGQLKFIWSAIGNHFNQEIGIVNLTFSLKVSF